jgi:hypothetical protein
LIKATYSNVRFPPIAEVPLSPKLTFSNNAAMVAGGSLVILIVPLMLTARCLAVLTLGRQIQHPKR